MCFNLRMSRLVCTECCFEYVSVCVSTLECVSVEHISLYNCFVFQYPFMLGVFIAVTWCLLVCLSRIYLGMHNILVRKSYLQLLLLK